MAQPPDTLGRRLLRAVLVGAVESVARGVTKGLESIVDDAGKVAAREKARLASWRETNVGEIEITPTPGDGDEADAGRKVVQ